MEIKVTKWDEMNSKVDAEVPSIFGKLFAQKIGILKSQASTAGLQAGPPGFSLVQKLASQIGRRKDSEDSIGNDDDDDEPAKPDPNIQESQANFDDCHSHSKSEGVKSEDEGKKKKRDFKQ